tara:strand:+ start:124 stop:456 length:333 start_codon:yes stop_codon:yes gene_type:complete
MNFSNYISNILILLSLILFSLSLKAQDGVEQELKQGKRLFASSCAFCHASLGKREGRGGPKLAGIEKNHDEVMNIISNGKSGKGMPSFKASLSEEKIRLLAKYIKSLPSN